MTGGIQIEYTVNSADTESVIEKVRTETIEAVRSTLDEKSKNIITDTLVYRVTGSEKFVVEA